MLHEFPSWEKTARGILEDEKSLIQAQLNHIRPFYGMKWQAGSGWRETPSQLYSFPPESDPIRRGGDNWMRSQERPLPRSLRRNVKGTWALDESRTVEGWRRSCLFLAGGHLQSPNFPASPQVPPSTSFFPILTHSYIQLRITFRHSPDLPAPWQKSQGTLSLSYSNDVKNLPPHL